MHKFFIVLSFSLIFSFQMNGQSATSSNDIVYEIFVQSFCDSNGDGKGDLKGLISKLDYIQDLGATAIWMMPIHPSPSYHKYDVTDYYAIHPDYGTMDDMDQLIKEAHQRHLKVILDFVINHTSDEHPWFKASASSPSNPYRNYYIWRDYNEVKDEIEKKTTTYDSDNLTQWHAFKGQHDRYYGFFNLNMPDLNFDYPPVREEIYKIGAFWLNKGIDGFRLDAAKHIYPDDRIADTRKFWEEFSDRMRQVKPDVKIIGEVWSDPMTVASLFSGLHSLFNFELTRTIPGCIQEHNPNTLITSYTTIIKAYNASSVPYEDATLLSNHDMDRIRSTLGDDVQKAKLAASILLTLPGTPYIYYGEEIGMLGKKPDPNIREPFLWDDQTAGDTSWIKPKYTVKPDVMPLDQQMNDSNSIYNHYKKWIEWRKAYPALYKGTIVFIPPQYPHVLGYIRSYRDQRIMVIHNLDEKEIEVRVMDPFTALDPGLKVTGEHTILLPAYGSTLLQIKDE